MTRQELRDALARLLRDQAHLILAYQVARLTQGYQLPEVKLP